MTNIENQKKRNNEKWLKSELYKQDLSGQMPWCTKCKHQTCTHSCNADQAKRDAETLCAKAYNRLKRIK
jgi:hypothetical protein